MAAEILRFSPTPGPEEVPETVKETPVAHNTLNIESELLEALGRLAIAQERGGSLESLNSLGRNVAVAFKRMTQVTEVDEVA